MENVIKKRVTWSTETYLEYVNSVHNNKYNYPEFSYAKLHDKIKIECPKHGIFMQSANHHKKGSGCAVCAQEINTDKQRDTTESFILKAKKVFNKFNYDKVEYGKSAHEEVEISCENHGSFKITPNAFLTSTYGCPNCGREEAKKKLINNNTGSWKRSDWCKLAEGLKVRLYIIHLYNEEESFYKIGITKKEVKRRFSKKLPYKYTIIKIVESYNAGFIYDLEKILLKATKNLKYKPKRHFAGHTECREVFDLKSYAECH